MKKHSYVTFLNQKLKQIKFVLCFFFFTFLLSSFILGQDSPLLNSTLNSNFQTDLNSDLNSTFDTNLNSDLKSDLNPGLNSNLSSDLDTDLNTDLNTDLSTDLNSDLDANFNVDFNFDFPTDIDSNLDTDLNSSLFSDQQSTPKEPDEDEKSFDSLLKALNTKGYCTQVVTDNFKTSYREVPCAPPAVEPAESIVIEPVTPTPVPHIVEPPRISTVNVVTYVYPKKPFHSQKYIGPQLMMMKIDAVRYSPLKFLNAWAGLSLQHKRFGASFGYSSHTKAEGERIDGTYYHFVKSDVKTLIWLARYAIYQHPVFDIHIGYMSIRNSGTFWGMDIDSSKLKAYMIGLTYRTANQWEWNILYFPTMSHEWELKMNSETPKNYTLFTESTHKQSSLGNIVSIGVTIPVLKSKDISEVKDETPIQDSLESVKEKTAVDEDIENKEEEEEEITEPDKNVIEN